MKRIYIIGSISQMAEIMSMRDKLQEKKCDVRIPKPNTSCFKDCVDECFKNIQWCDEIIVLSKLDGTIGESVTHELCFAEYLHKEISYS